MQFTIGDYVYYRPDPSNIHFKLQSVGNLVMSIAGKSTNNRVSEM